MNLVLWFRELGEGALQSFSICEWPQRFQFPKCHWAPGKKTWSWTLVQRATENKQTNHIFSSDSVSNVTFQVTLKFLSLFCAWFGDSRSFKFASCFGSPFYMWTIWYDTDSFINRFIRGKHEPSSPATCPCLYPGCGFVPVILILQQSLARVCGVKDFQIPPYGYFSLWLWPADIAVCLDFFSMFMSFFHVLQMM